MIHRYTRYSRRLYLPLLLVVANFPAQALTDDTVSLLKRHAGFTDDQIAEVKRGNRVVRMLDTGSQSEVAFVGVTRLPISLKEYLDRVRAGSLYRTGDIILQFGRFAESPSIADLKPLHFESFDLRSELPATRHLLRATRNGSCRPSVNTKRMAPSALAAW